MVRINVVMFVVYVFTLFGCTTFARSGRVKRIVGGTPIPCGQLLQISSLRNSTKDQHLCGATIITPNKALTAAHCVPGQPEQYILKLVNHCVHDSSDIPTARVIDVIIHEEYDKFSRAHDIAVLKIKIELNDISWMKDSLLPTASFGLTGECIIYGNGYKDYNLEVISEDVEAAEVQVVSLDYCLEMLGPYVAPSFDSGMLCAFGQHSDACQGDSGGPLICHGRLQGISSYGMSCGVADLPGVYTSIGSHLKWIYENIEQVPS